MEVFISHGFAQEDARGDAFLRRLHAALDLPAENLVPFLDRVRLQEGYVWRSELHEALARCGAGIIVLSQRSFKSDWVKKEAAILSWRRALQVTPAFRLHVVIFDDLDEDALERDGLGPMQLTEIQALRCAWDDADIDRVVGRLAADLCELAASVVRRVDWTPLDQLREYLAARLATIVQVAKLQELAADIDDRGMPLSFGPAVVDDCANFIAGALLRNCYGPALGSLAAFMERLHALGVARESRRDIFGVAAALWIDPQCAAVFHPRFDPVRSQRAAFIGLLPADAEQPQAAYQTKMLARRANPMPRNPEVLSVASPRDDLTLEIKRKLIDKFGAKVRRILDDDDIDDATLLQHMGRFDDPIYVMMKFPVDEELLEELLQELPGFLFVGLRVDPAPPRGDSRWRRVDPPLHPKEIETRSMEYFNTMKTYDF